MLLIVDDDPSFLENAQAVLDHGRGIFFAGDATQARQLLQAIGPDFSVAMVDLDLPGEDGFTLIREMHDRFPQLPVIAISGAFQRQVLETAKIVGAVDALRKPVSPEWNAALLRARAR